MAESGEPIFEVAPVDATIDYLANELGFSADEIESFVGLRAEEARAKHEALSNNPPKMMSNPIEYRQAKADWQLAVSVAEGAMNYWGDVMSAIQAGKGAQAVADNAEAEVVENEPQGVRPPKKKPSNSMSAQIERMADKYGEPTDLYHFVLKSLLSGGYKFKWGDNAANGTRGLSSHLGLSGRGEMSRRLWLLNNQGMSPEAVAERIEANFGRDDVTTAEVLNEILDILRSMPSRQSMFDEMQSYYQELARANDAAAQQEAWDRAILEDMAESRGFLSVEEMEAYEEVVSAELAEIGFTDEEWEKYSNFVAEQIIAEENERRNETAQSDEQGGSYGIRQGGGEVLPEPQVDDDRGDETVAGRPAAVDVSDDNADGASQAGQDGEVAEGLTDSQGNPVDAEGRLVLEEITSIDQLTDEDFTRPTRSVRLPALPGNVDNAIGANGKAVIIKKNIFEKNAKAHKDLSPDDSRLILSQTLYAANLYGQNRKTSRPYNWILVHLADKNTAVIIEVNGNKEYLEIVNWHYLNEKQLNQKRSQAEREGGLILALESAAGNTSNDLSSVGKDSEEVGDVQTSEGLSDEILYRDQWDRYSEAREKIREITGARGYRNNSAYAEGVTEDGETWVIRVSDHPANIDNFDRYNEDAEYILSIVIDEEFDEREARRRHDPITNDYNRWQVVVDPRNINYETLSYGIERFKRTGNGIYVWDGAQERMFRPSDTLASVNERFNEELEAFADGTHHGELHLGEPGEVLQASGLNASEMYITPRTLKTHLNKHGLSVEDIRNLPMALQNPLMVYEWGSKAKSLVVITQIPRGDQRITIAVKLERGGERLEVNEIASVHGKDAERFISEMVNAKEGGLNEALRYVDKNNALEWLGLVPPKGTASLTSQELDIAKIIEKFENPTIEQENNAESGENAQTFADVAVSAGEKLGVKVVVDPTLGSKGSYNLSTGEVRVNPDAHLTEADVERTVVHEVIGHGGMQALLGERFDGVCKMVFEQMSDEQVADIRRRHGKGLSDAEVGAEYMAETAERMADPLPTLTDSPYSDAHNNGRMSIPKQLRQLWERIKGWIREAVRRRGIAVAMTDADIRYMIATASRKAKEGKLQEMIDHATETRRLRRIAQSQDAVEGQLSQPLMRPKEGADSPLVKGIAGMTDAELVQRLELDGISKVIASRWNRENTTDSAAGFRTNMVDASRPIHKVLQRMYGLDKATS